MQVQPYVFFDGRCEEAVEFYRGALGAEVTMLMRYKDSPDPAMVQPGAENKVMHASLRIGDTRFWPPTGEPKAGRDSKGLGCRSRCRTGAGPGGGSVTFA